MDKKIIEIAKKYFDVETLEKRNRDSLDFYDVSISSIKAALEAAYRAGQENIKKIVNDFEYYDIIQLMRPSFNG